MSENCDCLYVVSFLFFVLLKYPLFSVRFIGNVLFCCCGYVVTLTKLLY